MIVLDTDHLSVLFFEQRHPGRDDLSSRLLAAQDDVAATVISLEEQMRGWLAAIKRRAIEKQVDVYPRLTQLVDYYSEWNILPFDEKAVSILRRLRGEKIRIGPQDLKIGSICLVHDALLLSANLVDFERVPGLRVEDWLHSKPR